MELGGQEANAHDERIAYEREYGFSHATRTNNHFVIYSCLQKLAEKIKNMKNTGWEGNLRINN